MVLVELDLATLQIPFHHVFGPAPTLTEPQGCLRLRGPIGAEDAVVLSGSPPVIITGELDAGAHEFTNLGMHGTSASTSPSGTLWALDRLLAGPRPRLTPLVVPRPTGVTLHTHGLGLHDDVLFAVNHGFA